MLLKIWLAFFLCQDVSLVYSMFSFVTTDLPTKEYSDMSTLRQGKSLSEN